MSKVTLDLAWRTDPAWADTIVAHFDAFLVDHANCERKASALAMSFVVKYADRTPIIQPLIDLAREELAHFDQVYRLMAARGLTIGDDTPDPYVNALLGLCRHGRAQRYVDRMLTASIVETRGAERFRLIHEALGEPGLKAFYRDLWASEARHGNLFVQLLLLDNPADEVHGRLAELVQAEAEIAAALPWRPSLH